MTLSRERRIRPCGRRVGTRYTRRDRSTHGFTNKTLERFLDDKIIDVAGTHALLSTPFDERSELDLGSLDSLLDRVIAGGVDGVVVLGTTGEFFTLTAEERAAVAARAVRHVAGRAVVTVGVGAVATAAAVEYAQHAESVGADCVMVFPPLYFDFSPESQIEHLVTIAKSTSLPVMLYDGAGGIAVPVAVIEAVARRTGNIRAVKLALPDPGRVSELVRGVPDVVPLAGSDPTLIAALQNGARGIAIATAMIQPEEIVALYRAFGQSDLEQAGSIFATAITPSVVATSTPKHEFIARFKEVLLEQGVISSATVRRPLRPIADTERSSLLTTMRDLGVV